MSDPDRIADLFGDQQFTNAEQRFAVSATVVSSDGMLPFQVSMVDNISLVLLKLVSRLILSLQ